MSKLVIELLIILLLLLANGVFAMAETAVISARRARLQRMASAGSAQARAALDLANNPNQFLATVQIGITLIGILAGVFAGATIAEEISILLTDISLLAPYAETIGVSLVVLTITYLSLIVGELVPKRLALNNPERIASTLAAPMRVLSGLSAPVVRILSGSTDAVVRVLGIRPPVEPSITSEELKILIEQSRESGAIEASEQDMIERVLQLDERRVGAFMTSRTNIVPLDIDDDPQRSGRKIASSQTARFLVVKGGLDNVLGIVHAEDLLSQSLAGRPFDLAILLRPPLFVPENVSALRVLELFKQEGAQMALIADEYGGIEGVVTHNDLLEGIAGYIPSGGETPEPQATRRADGSWLLDGLLSIEELEELFPVPKFPDAKLLRYQTVGGFVMTQVQSIPTVGQRFEWGALRFEVVDMDGNRVDKVLVTSIEPETGQNA